MNSVTGLSKKYSFAAAFPIWEKGKEKEMNQSLVFRAAVHGNGQLLMHIAAWTRYQIFINGEFFAAGPARAARGFYRAGEYDLTGRLSDGENTIAILTAGYNANSYYLTDEPSFLCAELIRDGEILFATGTEKDFSAVRYSCRLQKVQRYSFQRPFTENYASDTMEALTAPLDSLITVTVSRTDNKNFIERNVPFCEYRELTAEKAVSSGVLKPAASPKICNDRSLVAIGETLKGFPENELDSSIVNEVYKIDCEITQKAPSGTVLTIEKNGFAVYDMGVNTTGYISLSVKAENDTVLYAVFNERLPENGCPDPGRDGCANVVKWTLTGGREIRLLSFEPYTYRFIQLIAPDSAVTVGKVAQKRETYPDSGLTGLKKMKDEELQSIYDAAVQTFMQNATDIFMDCPSRERAGWLCDSFFTSRVEKALTGKSLVEHNFLENFIMAESFPGIPEGMLPMCYPSDHNDGVYIPNWAMWYVIELREYFGRTGDAALVAAAKERVYKLLDFFGKYENADGLLSDLDSWIFVEWSKANDYVRDVNYPTNMLFSMVLDAAAELYADGALKEKAEKLRQTVREKSFDGEFFVDNAVRENGIMKNTRNRSETCQYYAFFTGTATKELYPDLFGKLLGDFGPDREMSGKYPEIAQANAFIGNYLRLQILFSEKLYDKAEKEIRDFFLPMARATGTLWENMTDRASCNHGFASHVACWLNILAEIYN